MPPTTYNYTISDPTWFPNDKVNGTALEDQIKADSAITTALDDIDVNITPDVCAITFSDALTAPEQTALDAVVTAHQGTLVTYSLDGVLPVGPSDQPVVVTEDLTWQLLGVMVTRPSFFSPDMNVLFGNSNGCHQGDGGQIRVVEVVDGQANEDKTNPPIDLPDTSGAMKVFRFTTNVPPRYTTVPNIYRLEARLNGATSLSIQGLNFGIVDFKVT
jgi:hypothetical protein